MDEKQPTPFTKPNITTIVQNNTATLPITPSPVTTAVLPQAQVTATVDQGIPSQTINPIPAGTVPTTNHVKTNIVQPVMNKQMQTPATAVQPVTPIIPVQPITDQQQVLQQQNTSPKQ